jgi:UDP-N-acetylmuramate dehydrogenase
MDPRVMEALREAGVPCREQEPFSRHTSMGVGGPAAVMVFPHSADELRRALKVRKELEAPHRVLGAGSNLIVADAGLDELVINTSQMCQVQVAKDGVVTAEAGANLTQAVVRSCRAGWKGLERAVGIPGSVGGAAVMNAGAYGFSIGDVVREVVTYDAAGERGEAPGDWSFEYRRSSIPAGSAVASVAVGLSPGDPEELGRELRELQKQRVVGQPVGRSAGCIFKNPPGGHAGKIIDDLGLKGRRRGGAVVSPEHANFIVNDGGASSADILELLEGVRETVSHETGIDLEPEVKIWGAR